MSVNAHVWVWVHLCVWVWIAHADMAGVCMQLCMCTHVCT